jgi:hypothetical protein
MKLRLGAAIAAAALALAVFASLGSHAEAQPYTGYMPAPNLIQNGDFAFDRRHAGASVTLTSGSSFFLPAERWSCNFNAASNGSTAPAGRQVALSSGLTLLTKELKYTSSGTASTSTTAGQIGQCEQSVEANDTQDLQWGTASAEPVAYGFWLKSSLASSVVPIAVQNTSQALSYTTSCTTSATAATWTYCPGVIPGPTTGTWANTPGTIGLIFILSPECGTTYQAAAAGVWSTGQFNCPPGTTQFAATASATLEIAAVKVERGVSQSAFVADPAPVALQKLNRFFQTDFLAGTAPAQNVGTGTGETCFQNPIANGQGSVTVALSPPMYAAPTLTTYSPAAATAAFYDVTGSAAVTIGTPVPTPTSLYMPTGATVATIAHEVCVHWAADTAL